MRGGGGSSSAGPSPAEGLVLFLVLPPVPAGHPFVPTASPRPPKVDPFHQNACERSHLGVRPGQAHVYGLPFRLWEHLSGSGFWIHSQPKGLWIRKKGYSGSIPRPQRF